MQNNTILVFYGNIIFATNFPLLDKKHIILPVASIRKNVVENKYERNLNNKVKF